MDLHHHDRHTETGLVGELADVPFPSENAERAFSLFESWERFSETPLVSAPGLARRAGVSQVFVKDERSRMGLGSFKALGAAYVIARDARDGVAEGKTYVTASAGNHGLSLAMGAAEFGARSVVFLSDTVPESFADRLRRTGADVRRHGAIYEGSMHAAAQAAKDNGWELLSDSSWVGYYDKPRVLMEGYLVLMQEVAAQTPEPPTHIFLQAGVGGLATACAAYARRVWRDVPRIIVVEPEVAPALYASIIKQSAQVTEGPASDMGRLDCKEPSLIALKGLSRDADAFMLISEEEGANGKSAVADAGLHSSSSGAAGVAGLLAAEPARAELGLDDASRILCILSEEADA